MKIIRIGDAAHRAIVDAAILPFHETAVRQPDGIWLVPLEDETWERLQQSRLPGETDDDAILRLVNTHLGRRPN